MVSLITLNHIVAALKTDEQLQTLMTHVQLSDLFHWMASASSEIQEHSIWLIDNVAQDFRRFHGELLSNGVIRHITKVGFGSYQLQYGFTNPFALQVIESNSMVDLVAFRSAQLLETLTRVTEVIPPSQYCDDLVNIVPSLGSLLTAKYRSPTMLHGAGALVNITSDRRLGSDDKIVVQVLATDRMLSRLITLAKLKSGNPRLAELAVSAVTNMCFAAKDQRLLVIVKSGMLDVWTKLLETSCKLVPFACETMMQLCQGSTQVLKVLHKHGVFAPLLELAQSSEHPARKTAEDAVICALFGADQPQAEKLVEDGAFDVAMTVLQTKGDPDAVLGVLNMIRVLPQKFDNLSEFLAVEKVFHECGGWRQIGDLRTGGDTQEIQTLATALDKRKMVEYVKGVEDRVRQVRADRKRVRRG